MKKEDKYKGVKNFGLPYQGSKNRITKKIMEILPSGNRFVDLFCGGCAMTHCAILSGKYNSYLINDINTLATKIFIDACNGRFKNERRWISRKEFFELKDTDGYARLCYSFGNDQRSYLYSPEIETYKKACHYAIVFDDWNDFQKLYHIPYQSLYNNLKNIQINTWQDIQTRRLRFMSDLNKKSDIRIILQNLLSLERIQSLEILATDNITSSNLSYDKYQYQFGDVVYCDPPYKNTKKYNNQNFDNDKFWDWVRKQPYPIYVSEYNAPDDFISVLEIEKCKNMGGGKTASKKAIENVFVHKRFKI